MKSIQDRATLSGRALTYLLTLVYFCSYMTRKNFAVCLQQIITETGIPKDTLSVILVTMTVTYGIGQLISGRLADKIKPANIIFCGLLCATAVNLLVPILPFSVPLMAVLWGINGFAQSMLWPPIIRILVISCDDKGYGHAMVRVCQGCSVATVLLYLVTPLAISWFGSWRAVLVLSATIGVVVTALWGSLRNRIQSEPAESVSDTSESPRKKGGFRIPRAAIFPFLLIVIGIILHGMLRDGVATYMPTYLAETYGLSNEISIFSGVFPALFSMACFSLCGALFSRFFNNEVFCASVIFGVASVAAALLLLPLSKGGAILSIVCMTLMTGCMHGINLMLITHVPKRFRKSGNVSTVAGLVNSCTYVGEAAFTYGISVLAVKQGWRVCLFVCLAIALAGVVCCLLATRPWKRFFEKP